MVSSEFAGVLGVLDAGDAGVGGNVVLSVGQVVELNVYGRFTGLSLGVIVRVLALEVDVVSLELEGSAEWRRLPRGLVLRVIAEYRGEVPFPLELGGLLWAFQDEFIAGDGRGGRVSSGSGRGVRDCGVFEGRGSRAGFGGGFQRGSVDPGFRSQCYGNMMLLLTRAAGVGRVGLGGYMDDLHCVARLFVVAARRAGRLVWDVSLSNMMRTLFDMEGVLYGGGLSCEGDSDDDTKVFYVEADASVGVGLS